MKKQVILNLLSAILFKLGKLVVGLLTVPLFFETLGKNGYGLVVLLSSVIGLSFLLEFGIKAGLTRYYTKALVDKNYAELNGYFSSSFIVYTFIWLAISSAVIIIGPSHFSELFNVSPQSRTLIKPMLFFYVIPSLFVSFIIPNFSAITTSLHRFDLVNYRDLIITILTYPVLYITLKNFQGGVIGWAIISLTIQFIHLTFHVILSKNLVPTLRLELPLVNISLIKNIFSFGIITFVGSISRRLKLDSDPVLLSIFINPASVSLYRSGVTMPGHTRPIIGAFSGQLYTVATAMHEQGKTTDIQRLFEQGSKYTLLLGTLMLCFFMFFAESLAFLWLGDKLNRHDLFLISLCMRGMALVDFCFYLEGTSYSILYGMDKLKFMTYTDFFLGVLNIASTVFLLLFTSFPFPIVLFPTIILEGIARPLYFFYTAKIIKYDLNDVWRKVYKPIFFTFLGCASCTGLFSYLILSINLSDISYLLFGSFVLICSWILFTYIFAFNEYEKREVRYTLIKIQNYLVK